MRRAGHRVLCRGKLGPFQGGLYRVSQIKARRCLARRRFPAPAQIPGERRHAVPLTGETSRRGYLRGFNGAHSITDNARHRLGRKCSRPVPVFPLCFRGVAAFSADRYTFAAPRGPKGIVPHSRRIMNSDLASNRAVSKAVFRSLRAAGAAAQQTTKGAKGWSSAVQETRAHALRTKHRAASCRCYHGGRRYSGLPLRPVQPQSVAQCQALLLEQHPLDHQDGVVCGVRGISLRCARFSASRGHAPCRITRGTS